EYHKVKAGESLAKLSKKYNVSVDQIKEWNNLDKKGTILPGQKLIVNQTEAAQKEPALASNDRGSRNNKETREPAPTKTYKVKKGDTYSSLATKFSISVEDLKALNSKAGNKLKAGEKIIVSGPEPAAENDNLASKGNSQENKKQQGKQKCINYKVQPGDTLWRIANMHKGISIDEIKKWNNLKSEEVVPGQVIKIVVPS
ncbi:MAG: LysM peptidoglycan-binding domain-containing protein, partial [Bacteroidota bacterium]|nr:LysM peptidoglycan-binding domain-containing protein [Bacteroidota bacterium]